MTDEMWTHENEGLEYRQGFRDGLLFSIDIVKKLIAEVRQDGRVTEATWISVVEDWLDDELSMYEVGDEG